MNPVFDISIYWIIVANQKDLLYNLPNPSPLTSFKQKTIEFVKHERNFVRKNPGIPVKPPSTGYPKDFKTNWIFMSWSFLRRLVKLFLPEDLRRPTCESFTYFPNWLCFKAFVWALPVHGDDLHIYIYNVIWIEWSDWYVSTGDSIPSNWFDVQVSLLRLRVSWLHCSEHSWIEKNNMGVHPLLNLAFGAMETFTMFKWKYT